MENPRIKTYIVKTYGCQMNFSDSERIDTVMQSAGLKPVRDMNKADVIIFNTCSVRQSAEDRILGLGKQIKQLKNKSNDRLRMTDYRLPITVLTGCMAKRSWDETIKEIAYREKKYLASLKRQMPWVDIVLEIKDIAKLPKLLGLQPYDNLSSGALAKEDTTMEPCNNSTIPRQGQVRLPCLPAGRWRKQFNNYLDIPPNYKSGITAYIPISTGCNEFCTYCIVPYARGKQIDRLAEDIIEEGKMLVKKGYKDIMLLGQSVNSWKNPPRKLVQTSAFEPDSINTFLDLLKAIDDIQGGFWLTFLSSHPNYFTQELIDYFAKSANAGTKAIAEGKKLTIGNHIRPYLNLALQSGSNKILKRMNRKYTVEKFTRICKQLKERIPNLNLSTDIIVGFPTETENDFKATVDTMKKLEFDMAYINKYSPRKGTAAAGWHDDVPWQTKEERDKKLTGTLANTALKKNKRYLTKEVRVLIEEIKHKESKYYAYGKTFNYKNIKIPLSSQRDLQVGQFVTVQIKKATSWHLEGVPS